MKKKIFEFRFILLLPLIVFFCSALKSQTLPSKDSLIQIQKIKIFPVSNPAPQYIVEIKNDMTISFYNNIPENFSENHPGFKAWFIIDSTTIAIESSDFIELVKIINGLDLSSINTLNKKNVGNEPEVFMSGGSFDNYIIEKSNQRIEFSVTPNNKAYLSNSAMKIRNIFDKIEDKYKPKK
jgi:hypothetical protein